MADPLLVAVLAALGGARRDARVAAVGRGVQAAPALLAASGTAATVDRDADVVVAGDVEEAVVAAALLAPGGRLVALAPDADAASRAAVSAGLLLRHVEAVRDGVAWSAERPLA